MSAAPRLFIIMGVSGCGKSTIAEGIARSVNGTYLDGDDFHPPSNIEKMSNGIPLTDEDRFPWLKIVAHELSNPKGPVVIACSALKRVYRDIIQKHSQEPVLFVYLDGSIELISARMAARPDHFMPTSLLESQFATLERPASDELTISVDIDQTPDRIINDAVAQIKAIT